MSEKFFSSAESTGVSISKSWENLPCHSPIVMYNISVVQEKDRAAIFLFLR